MNKTLFTGRLGMDPEVRYTQEGTGIARFSLAVDRLDKEHTTGFINCVAFGKLCDFTEKYLKKGVKIEFEGHVSPGSYTDKDGNKRYTFDFVAEKLGFAESKNTQGASNNSAPAPAPEPGNNDGFMSIPDGIDEDLPFN